MQTYHLLHANNSAIRKNSEGNFLPICDLGKKGRWKAHKGHLLDSFKRGEWKHVMSMKTPNIEEIFTSTQNHEEPWNPLQPQRSTSVGDLILAKDGETLRMWIVSLFGFEEVEAYQGCNPKILIKRAYARVEKS